MKIKTIELSDSLASRFFKYVTKGPSSACWEWMGGRTALGYGRLRVSKEYGIIKAHRLSYFIYHGDPGNMHVLHKCDNPSCVNPDHLFLGTHADNMKDASTKGIWAGKGRGVSRNKGMENGSAKLEDEVIDDIRALASEGKLYQREIALIFSISQGHVSQIVNAQKRV